MAKHVKTHVASPAGCWRKVGGVMPMTSKIISVMLVLSKNGRRYISRFQSRFREQKSRRSRKRLFHAQINGRKGGDHMTQKLAPGRCRSKALTPSGPSPEIAEQESAAAERGARIRRNIYRIPVTLIAVLLISTQPVFAADTIWTKFTEVMKDVYGKLLGISTIIAVTAATIALLVRMISRNQRAVDEATTWLTRITVTWIILNTLGFIIAYIQPWFTGGQYVP